MAGKLAGLARTASLLGLVAGPAFAEGWTVERVAGTAWAISAGAHSTVLARGMTVEDGLTVATAADGRLRISRAGDVLTLSPGSSLVVMPGAGRETTRVIQRNGEVEVAVAPRQRRSFSVETPFLAAVVKGTQFTVTADARSSGVRVSEGLVGVKDFASGETADVGAGQSAAAGPGRAGLEVSGAVAVLAGRPEAAPVSTLDGLSASPESPASGASRGGTADARDEDADTGERVSSLVDRASPARSLDTADRPSPVSDRPVGDVGNSPSGAGPGAGEGPVGDPSGGLPDGPATGGLPGGIAPDAGGLPGGIGSGPAGAIGGGTIGAGPVTVGAGAGPAQGGIGIGGSVGAGGVSVGGQANVGPGGISAGVNLGGISIGIGLGGSGGGLKLGGLGGGLGGLGGPTRNEK